MSIEQEKYPLSKLASGLYFGEGPRWKDGVLYISDMLGKKVYAIDAAGNKTVVAEVTNKPNGLGFLPSGELIICSMHDTCLYRHGPAGLELYADLSGVCSGYLGDMVIDRLGRIYVDDVGARVFEGEAMKPGRLIIVEPNGQVSIGLENCAFPNGIVITPDQKTLIFAESTAELLSAVDLVDGRLENRRVFLDMKKEFPSEAPGAQRGGVDGVAIDAEGGIWLSLPMSEQFARIDSRGVITDRIMTPGYDPIACTLGGDDGKTLFLVATKVNSDDLTGSSGERLFKAMVSLRTESTIFTTRVAVGRGAGYP